MDDTSPPRARSGEETVLPLLEERLRVRRRVRETGRVRVAVTTVAEARRVEETLRRRVVEVERVPVGRAVAEAPAVREEGDTLVIPVVEEVLVVERRLVLREEVRVRLATDERREAVDVTLLRQDAEVSRLPPAATPDQETFETMATQTITGLFDTRPEAERAVEHLVQHLGLDRDRIVVHAAGAENATAGTFDRRAEGHTTMPETSGESKGFLAGLRDLFMPEEDRATYAEGIRRGGIMVSAEVPEERLDDAVRAFEDNGAVDLDAREEEWRSGGWTGGGGVAQGGPAARGGNQSGQAGGSGGWQGGIGGMAAPDHGGRDSTAARVMAAGADRDAGGPDAGRTGSWEGSATAAALGLSSDGTRTGVAAGPVVGGQAHGSPAPTAGASVGRVDEQASPFTTASQPASQRGEMRTMGRDAGGDPPGTMLSRGVDDVAGTNVSGARPGNERSDPPGTMLSRGVDDALGTNISGARPESERSGSSMGAADGTPGNPPGTMLSRGTDDVLGTNVSGARPENEGTRGGATGTAAFAGRTDMAREGDAEAIPIVEERLRVGKRVAQAGRVRVRSYVVETPVNEQVTLREERVQVERRPVDRPLTDADTAAFRDRTIEATETAEEAVVAKEARVREEVVVRKTAEERTQTVSDTVRRTEVEVEDDRTAGTRTTGSSTIAGGTTRDPQR